MKVYKAFSLAAALPQIEGWLGINVIPSVLKKPLLLLGYDPNSCCDFKVFFSSFPSLETWALHAHVSPQKCSFLLLQKVQKCLLQQQGAWQLFWTFLDIYVKEPTEFFRMQILITVQDF